MALEVWLPHDLLSATEFAVSKRQLHTEIHSATGRVNYDKVILVTSITHKSTKIVGKVIWIWAIDTRCNVSVIVI